jgi:hypothetical protein
MAQMVGKAGIVGSGLIRQVGKGATEECLDRFDMSELTKGDPMARRMGFYGKSAPGTENYTPTIAALSPAFPVSNRSDADKG